MRVVSIGLLSVLVGCGAGVAPLDPRDPSLPPESQQWLAAAQDGVVAARAQRDGAAADLQRKRDWAERITGVVDLDAQNNRRLEVLASAEVALAEARLAEAERVVTFAEAKLELAYAERSVHHDLGNYELEPIEQEVDAAREAVDVARQQSIEAARRLLEATDEFWASYAALAQGGGDTRTFWIGDREPIADVVEDGASE